MNTNTEQATYTPNNPPIPISSVDTEGLKNILNQIRIDVTALDYQKHQLMNIYGSFIQELQKREQQQQTQPQPV